MTEKKKNLLVRSVSGLFFVTIMVVGIAFRPEAMIVLFSLITGMTVWEYTGLVNKTPNVSVNRFITTTAGVCLFLGFAGYSGNITQSYVFLPYLLTIAYLLISELYTKNADPLKNMAYTMFSQLYIALPLSLVNILTFHGNTDGSVFYDGCLLLSIFVFIWINDTGAYVSGSLFGKHQLFPRISPNKTWEGSIGGAVFVLIAAAITGNLADNGSNLQLLNTVQWMGLGLVVVCFGTWGDLAESLIKRTLNIKDSGNVLPGHGGMLDRFDSSLLAIPASVIYLYTIILFS